MSRRALLLAVPLAVATAVPWLGPRGPAVIEAAPGDSAAIVAAAPSWATVRLLPGTHPPLTVPRALTLEGAPGAVVRGPVEVKADGARLTGLSVRGGETGILVRRARDVSITGTSVRGAELIGIEVVEGSATILDCSIAALTSPYGRGISIRNATGHPRSVVRDCDVSSGQEGLVSHVSRVEFLGNRVAGTRLRGIAVNEMSEGLVAGNRVSDGVGIGIYCGDMSHCEVRENDVRGITVDDGVRSRAGYGVVAHYRSTLRAEENRFDVAAAQPVGVFLGSQRVDYFPLAIWPPGWAGAVPALWVSGLSLLGLAGVRWGVGHWLRRPRRVRPRRGVSPLALNVLLAGFVVQSFHMLEHGVQVFQVYVAQSEVRSGLAGARVDTEWVHFAFNAGVLFFLAWAWWLLRPGGPFGDRAGRGAPWLLAALVVQGYHFAEHVAKIFQHVSTAVDPAPGIFGSALGLVWFHYGINLAVYAGMAIPLATVLWRAMKDGSLTVFRPPRRVLQPEPPVSS